MPHEGYFEAFSKVSVLVALLVMTFAHLAHSQTAPADKKTSGSPSFRHFEIQ